MLPSHTYSVLKEPEVWTGVGKENISRGSWYCNRVNSPAVLNTIAVIDLTVQQKQNGADIDVLLQTCQSEGLLCPRICPEDVDNSLTETLPPGLFRTGRVDLSYLQQMAMNVRQKAYHFFLHGGYNCPFKTMVRCMGELRECVIVPIDRYSIFYFDGKHSTHEISGDANFPDTRFAARLRFVESAGGQAVTLIDPFVHFKKLSNEFD